MYDRWLARKAAAHARRDQKRFGEWKGGADYRDLIHAAVIASEGKDAYTGETLDWSLISTYNNEASKVGRHGYKAGFALLPTVDHVQADSTDAQFCICSWRTNDSKHDLPKEAFLELCEKVLKHHGFSIVKAS
ncbi:MAG: hypothetical protein HY854_05535 [Burkholderiales bacterium]|nr:hypothetical protein [Burkholderiales bacterium]